MGGPGGKRLSPDAVGGCLVRLPGLLSLGTYPHTVEAVAKVNSVLQILGR